MEFDFSLKRISMIRAATSLWERENTTKEIRQFWKNTYDPENISSNIQGWTDITKKVLTQLKQDELPATLQPDLIHTVKQIGKKIYDWSVYLQEALPCNQVEVLDYTKHMCWTYYGAIDEVRIIKSFWINNPKLNIIKVGKFACNYLFEESIMEPLLAAVEENKEEYRFKDTNFNRHLFTYQMCCKKGNVNDYFSKLMTMFRGPEIINQIYHQLSSVEENMLRLCILEGYFNGVQYFWSKLNEAEKINDELVEHIYFLMIFHLDCLNTDDFYMYKGNQFVQMCLFFINRIPQIKLVRLFDQMETFKAQLFLTTMLGCWPWQEICISILKRTWDVLEEKEKGSVFHVLGVVTSMMKYEHDLGYTVNKYNKYQIMLKEFWFTIPVNLKQVDDQHMIKNANFTTDLLHIWDLASIKMILNSPYFIKSRNLLFNFGKERIYQKLVIDDKFNLLDEFINEVLVTKEEKKSFKHKLDVWAVIIKNHCYNHRNDFCTCLDDEDKYPSGQINPKPRYDILDKFLDWQCDSLEERRRFKDKINPKNVCQFFTEHGMFENADEFLNWRFESKDVIDSLKVSFKFDYFSSQVIYKTWHKHRDDVELAKKNSAMFLNWFLKTEKEVEEFKKEKLLNDQLDVVLHNFFMKLNYSKFEDEFLDWCLVSNEKLKEIKRRIIDNGILIQKCEKVIKHGELKDVEIFVKWVFDDENEKLEFIRTFSSSVVGLDSLDVYIRKEVLTYGYSEGVEKIKQNFLSYIDFWITPLESVDEVKIALEIKSNQYEGSFLDLYRIFIRLL